MREIVWKFMQSPKSVPRHIQLSDDHAGLGNSHSALSRIEISVGSMSEEIIKNSLYLLKGQVQGPRHLEGNNIKPSQLNVCIHA